MVKRIAIFLFGLIVAYLSVVAVLANVHTADYSWYQYLTRTEVRPGWFGFSLLRFREIEKYRDIDILFVGSSHCYRSFDPRIFSRVGLTTFNIGSDGQSPLNSHYLMRQ